ncbi:hydratase [Neiella marina]|uniref:Hydratase n=1 Tax=Neiella marina TaxID=508461 RepID=A0A8J2U2P9_9GAMM|nr:hydratase [Neiella marina]GGA66717.1 hydratase [Neiella marina]
MTVNVELAAQELLARRVPGTKAGCLADEQQPHSIDDALAIQQAMLAVKPATGWKCLLPPAEGQIIAAPIFADTVQRGDQVELFEDNGKARIEPEIAFILQHDLPASEQGYSEEQVHAAVGSCHMALELMQARFADDCDASFFERLADCMVNQGLFIGPEIDKQKAYAAATIDLTVSQASGEQGFAGKHPNQLPQNPLAWFINFMTKRGQSFKAGEAIITGSYAGIVEVDFDQQTTIKYDGLGEYKVTFSVKA